jgi:molybdopterin-binding protein
MASILKRPLELMNVEQQFGVFDDFIGDQTDITWIDTITDTGTAAVGDAVNGVMVLTPSDGTVADNDEVYLGTSNEAFLFAPEKPFLGVANIKFTETASGIYNCFVGFANAFAADLLINDGGGMRASGSLAAIYKVDGGTVWRCVTRSNSVVTDTVSTTSSTSTGYQKLEIEGVSFTSTQIKVIFRVNGVPLKDSAGREIVHTITTASATEMQFGFGAKLGAITNNDTLSIDYAGAWQTRT